MKLSKYVLGVTFSLFSVTAFSEGKVNNFNVKNVRVDASGKGYIEFKSALQGTPAGCSSNTQHLAFDLNTAGGKGIMSLALSAQASGRSITASGTGQCNTYGTVEDWSWGYITDQ